MIEDYDVQYRQEVVRGLRMQARGLDVPAANINVAISRRGDDLEG